jgi:hypothetical protein
MARVPAARIHVTSGSQGTVTKRSKRRARTSKTRSITTVPVVSTSDTPPSERKATIRAASPARKGSTLLRNWPRRRDSVVGKSPGRVSGANMNRQRSTRMKNASASRAKEGSRYQ